MQSLYLLLTLIFQIQLASATYMKRYWKYVSYSILALAIERGHKRLSHLIFNLCGQNCETDAKVCFEVGARNRIQPYRWKETKQQVVRTTNGDLQLQAPVQQKIDLSQ